LGSHCSPCLSTARQDRALAPLCWNSRRLSFHQWLGL
jgi:hypothetical protein